jgi:hypothetical protein
LVTEAERLRKRTNKMPRGTQREELQRKARQMDLASHIDEWLSFRLQPPKQ